MWTVNVATILLLLLNTLLSSFWIIFNNTLWSIYLWGGTLLWGENREFDDYHHVKMQGNVCIIHSCAPPVFDQWRKFNSASPMIGCSLHILYIYLYNDYTLTAVHSTVTVTAWHLEVPCLQICNSRKPLKDVFSIWLKRKFCFICRQLKTSFKMCLLITFGK